MKKAVKEHGRDELRNDVWNDLADGMRYVSTDFADDQGEDDVVEALRDLDEKRGTAGNRLYYLAVPPAAFETIVNKLGERRSAEGWTRLIVEKPFGHDRDSARHLNEILQAHFSENEVFRIDHYLGKETVQNMLALRFANGIFEPIWNRQFIDHIQITVAESIGIEGRAAFYEQAGVIRDIFQNHLLQLVALTAMEPPIDFTADSVRNEKVKVLRSLHTPGPKSVVRGQYGRGFIEGEEVPGYREEEGVAGDSNTETFVAAKLYVDNWRWADTPFYVRAGKRLPRRETTIAIQFQRAPHPPFAEIAGEGLRPNVLLIHVQPDEGVSLAIGAKVPGAGMSIRTVNMDFLYGGAFRTGLPEAYERLILDAMLGDATLFTRADEVDEQWALVDTIVAAWKRDRPNFPNYAAGTWGPAGADASDPPRRTELEAALSVVAQVERRLAELRRKHGEGTRTSVMTHVAWAPPQWEAAARRTLAGTRGATPLADDPALPRPEAGRRGRRPCRPEVLHHRRVVTRGVLRRDRAPPRRGAHAGARLDRRAAADHRPAHVLPLARAAAVGCARARAARGRLRPARGRLVGMAQPPLGLPEARAALRPDRRLGHRLGPWARLAWRASRRSGRSIKTAKALSVTGPKADALLLVGWLRSRLKKQIKLTPSLCRASSSAWPSTASRSRGRGAGRRARVTSCRPSSTSSAATRSTRQQSAQPAEVEPAVRRDGVVEPPARLLEDDPEWGGVPHREPEGVDGHLRRALGDEHVGPEVAEAAEVPRTPGALRHGPVERVEKRRVLEAFDRRDVDPLPVRVGSPAALRPPAAAERGRRDDCDAVPKAIRVAQIGMPRV